VKFCRKTEAGESKDGRQKEENDSNGDKTAGREALMEDRVPKKKRIKLKDRRLKSCERGP